MRATLEEAIMHTGTELQALKVKMVLTCHAVYRWICMTFLKVNETHYEWEKIKNHIPGVWNSSDIGLDLGKLHNQIQTLEHSWLDFTATGAAKDFFHTFSNFISGKNILSNIPRYAVVGALILLLIIILPCIVRILLQSIRKLATELHLAVLKNKKGWDVGGQSEALHPWQRSWGRRLDISKGRIEPQESTWKSYSIYRHNQSLPSLLICAPTYTSDFMGGCPPPPLSEKELT